MESSPTAHCYLPKLMLLTFRKLAEHVAQTRPTPRRPESSLAHPWHHQRPIYRREYRRFITNPRGGNPHKARKRPLRPSNLRSEGNHDFCCRGGVLSRKSPAQRHAALCYRRLERKFTLSDKRFRRKRLCMRLRWL